MTHKGWRVVKPQLNQSIHNEFYAVKIIEYSPEYNEIADRKQCIRWLR